jgi:hypothetical protein
MTIGMKTNYYFSSLFCKVVGSGMEKIRIQDKHPESAILKKADELWAFDGIARYLPV